MAIIDPSEYGASFPESLMPIVDPTPVEAFTAEAAEASDPGVRLFGVAVAAGQGAVHRLATPDAVGPQYGDPLNPTAGELAFVKRLAAETDAAAAALPLDVEADLAAIIARATNNPS